MPSHEAVFASQVTAFYSFVQCTTTFNALALMCSQSTLCSSIPIPSASLLSAHPGDFRIQ